MIKRGEYNLHSSSANCINYTLLLRVDGGRSHLHNIKGGISSIRSGGSHISVMLCGFIL